MISKYTMERLQFDYESFSADCSKIAAEELRRIEKDLIHTAIYDYSSYNSYDYIVGSQDVRVRREIYNTLHSLGYRVMLDFVDPKTPDWPTGHELITMSIMTICW